MPNSLVVDIGYRYSRQYFDGESPHADLVCEASCNHGAVQEFDAAVAAADEL